MATAVLLIHGILGRPEQFSYLLPLIPEEWEIRNITLKGHGGTPKDLGRYPMAEWKAEVHKEAVVLCEQYDHVVIIGHSLGTLFAIQESLRLPIKGLFLTNVPLGPRITPKLFKLCVQVFFDRVDLSDPHIVAGQKAYGISLDRNILHYIGWIPRYLELFREMARTRMVLEQVSVDAVASVSLKDEMAAIRTADILKNHTRMKVLILPDSGHFYYTPKDRKFLLDEFRQFTERHTYYAPEDGELLSDEFRQFTDRHTYYAPKDRKLLLDEFRQFTDQHTTWKEGN